MKKYILIIAILFLQSCANPSKHLKQTLKKRISKDRIIENTELQKLTKEIVNRKKYNLRSLRTKTINGYFMYIVVDDNNKKATIWKEINNITAKNFGKTNLAVIAIPEDQTEYNHDRMLSISMFSKKSFDNLLESMKLEVTKNYAFNYVQYFLTMMIMNCDNKAYLDPILFSEDKKEIIFASSCSRKNNKSEVSLSRVVIEDEYIHDTIFTRKLKANAKKKDLKQELLILLRENYAPIAAKLTGVCQENKLSKICKQFRKSNVIK